MVIHDGLNIHYLSKQRTVHRQFPKRELRLIIRPIHNVKEQKIPIGFIKNNKRNYFLSVQYRMLKPIQHVGGGERVRTDDLLLAKQVLSQLSYAPI